MEEEPNSVGWPAVVGPEWWGGPARERREHQRGNGGCAGDALIPRMPPYMSAGQGDAALQAAEDFVTGHECFAEGYSLGAVGAQDVVFPTLGFGAEEAAQTHSLRRSVSAAPRG
jgi:hypothetical protein